LSALAREKARWPSLERFLEQRAVKEHNGAQKEHLPAVPRPDPRLIATFESRQKGGHARAANIRARHDAAEQLRIERLAAGRRLGGVGLGSSTAARSRFTPSEIAALEAQDTATARVLLDRHRMQNGEA
jgi:hypothetical protein